MIAATIIAAVAIGINVSAGLIAIADENETRTWRSVMGTIWFALAAFVLMTWHEAARSAAQ